MTDLKELVHLYRVKHALTRSASDKVAAGRFVIDARLIVMQITNSAVELGAVTHQSSRAKFRPCLTSRRRRSNCVFRDGL
jgi:hypothetical protein